MKRALASTLTLLLAAALAAACGGKKHDDKAAAPAGGCDQLGARSVAQAMEHTPPGMTPEQVKALRALADEAGRAIATRCKADGWTADAIACGLKAKDPEQECGDKLTAEQKQKMTADVQAIFQRGEAALMPPAPPAPPPPPPPPPGATPPPAPEAGSATPPSPAPEAGSATPPPPAPATGSAPGSAAPPVPAQ